MALTGIAALAGCGSAKTTTVSVGETAARARAPVQTAPRSTPGRSSSPAAPTSQAKGQNTTSGPARQAPAPAFTQQPDAQEGLGTALEAVKRRGFSVGDTSTYHQSQTLRVLIGTRSASAEGHEDEQAFFFEDGRYLGTDTSQPSAGVKVISQSDTEVTLAYALYRPGDAPCCPKAGQETVRFQLDNGRLQALDAIPPVTPAAAGTPGRR